MLDEIKIEELIKRNKFLKPGNKSGLLLVSLLVFIVLATAAFVSIRAAHTQKPTYKTEIVKRGSLDFVVVATGNLQATNQVVIGSEVSGTIKTVDVDCNDTVKTGQVLARLDTQKIEAEIVKLKADLKSVIAQEAKARAGYSEKKAKLQQNQKLRTLSNNRTPSQSEMDTAEAALEVARADVLAGEAAVASQKASLRAKETELSKSIIRSPINGIVLSRKIVPGQTVAATNQTPELFILAENLNRMDLRVEIDEAEIGKITIGQHATFRVAAHPERIYTARVIQIQSYPTDNKESSARSSAIITYKAILTLDNSDLSLKPGMTAVASIIINKVENALLVSNNALRFSPPKNNNAKRPGLLNIFNPWAGRGNEGQSNDKDNKQVWVMKNNVPVPVPVRTGASQAGMTEIKEGQIEPGMEVAVDVLTGG